MGYLAVLSVMDGKRALGTSSNGRRINQRIIEDHMISHYKKLYSAKAVVDCSVPKSMRCNVKYIDQKRREQVKKDASGRTQSSRSLSQRSFRLDNTACSSRNDRTFVRGAESAYFNSGDSVMFSPRLSTSFHCKPIVYPSQLGAQPQSYRPYSELSYRSPNLHHLTLSYATSLSQEKFKSFQDATQKTYSGDLLNKHAHCFTQEKPFTPRTLKTDYNSTLSAYRYYRPARRKESEEKTAVDKCNQPDTHHKSMQRSSKAQDSPQTCHVDYEWSEEESNVLGHYGTENKFTASDLFLSSLRVSPEGMRSPIMRKVTAEEEELMYLEFITDVTNEVLLRGIYSDSVLQRLFERHIDMNKHRLAEDKMRHLLDTLLNDLQKPLFSPVTVIENKERESSLLHRHGDSSFQQRLRKLTTEDTSFVCFKPSKDKDMWKPDDVVPTLDTTPVNGSISKNARSVRQEEKEDPMCLEENHKKGNAEPSSFQIKVEDSHGSYADIDVLDELSRNIAETLNVSDIHSSPAITEQETFVKVGDDDF